MIVIGSSAVISILRQEDDAAHYSQCIATDDDPIISAANIVETSIVPRALKKIPSGKAERWLDEFIEAAGIATRRDQACAAASKGDRMTISFEKLKARLLANPKVKAEYDALAPEFEISAELIRARVRAGLSQAELAARMGTSQSAIARLESGHTLPSTKTLLRYAQATGSKFHVRLSAT